MSEGTDNLAGRGAIITGASQGLGREIARHFVLAGASVLLTARDEKPLRDVQQSLRRIQRPGQSVLIQPGDVSNRANCDAAIARAGRELPDLSILVNNAGVYGPKGALEDVDFDDWVKAMEINLFGAVYMCRGVIAGFKARNYGKIVNVSGGGATAPLPRLSAYAASKAALVRMTDTLAAELADWHIDVNAIAPGALNTRLLDEVLAAGTQAVGQAFYDRALKQQAEGGTPLEKGAALAVFLASARSDGITGRLISAVWDDWQALPERRQQLAGSDVYTLRRIVPKDRGMQ